jgi:hypothetical protein
VFCAVGAVERGGGLEKRIAVFFVVFLQSLGRLLQMEAEALDLPSAKKQKVLMYINV